MQLIVHRCESEATIYSCYFCRSHSSKPFVFQMMQKNKISFDYICCVMWSVGRKDINLILMTQAAIIDYLRIFFYYVHKLVFIDDGKVSRRPDNIKINFRVDGMN